MENKIKVHYYNNNILKESKDLSWPQHYKNFINDIIQNFSLINKNIEVFLKLVTDGGDINNIRSQDELEEYIEENNIKEFRFSIERKKESFGRQNPDPINIEDFEKLLDPNLFTEEEIDIDTIMDDILDKDEYIKKKESEENKYSDIFNQGLEKIMEEILGQKSKTMEEEINIKINNYSNLFFKEQKDAYNSMMDIKDNLADIKDQTDEMSYSINELHDSILNNDLILTSTKKIKIFEDPLQQRQKRPEEIYEELKNEFHDYDNLLDKKDIINKLLENELNKEEIKTSLNDKIKQIQIQEKENNEKAELVYKELNLHNHDLNKEEIISLIKEQNFNKENIQNYINKKISEQIYDNISKLNDIDVTNHNKEEVLSKIIELNFDIEQIKKSFKKIIKEDEPFVDPDNKDNDNNNNNGDNNNNNDDNNGDDIEDEEVNKLYLEIEEEFQWSGFIDEEDAKKIIRELNCNRDAIIDWIQNKLLNGDY